jgi:hypothetical protein
MEKQDEGSALEQLKKIDEECDGQIIAMTMYASISAHRGDNKRAIEILAKIIRHFPYDLRPATILGHSVSLIAFYPS